MQPPQQQQRSAFGYTTTTLVDRDNRNMLKNRDRREAAMITGSAPLSTDPTASLVTSAGYACASDRLKTGAAKELQQVRVQEKQRHNSSVDHLRERRQSREDARQAQMTSTLQKAQQDAAALAGTGVRNLASVPYSLISHDFTSEQARKQAAYEDQMTKHSFMTRTKKLEQRINPSGFNIINGSNRLPIDVPPKPQWPSE